MFIHVVQSGDTIQSIADQYEVSVRKLIQDNKLENPYDLVIGQCIVITVPELTYTVKEGDTLIGIAASHNVTVLQLLQNNPYLSEREYIYPGDIIIIHYNQKGKISTHGNTIPYINKDTLRKTLPYLTYLSILNYTATSNGDIITYYDDAEIIQITKEYGTIPLMLLTTLTIRGEANIAITYDILLNKQVQNRLIENVLSILKEKGYRGVNISFQYISDSNQQLFEDYFKNISERLRAEGYLAFVTINPDVVIVDSNVEFVQIDYSTIKQSAHNIIFMSYEWATTINPPSPISSTYNMNYFLDYINQYVSPDMAIIGIATIAYDWELPFSAGFSEVYSMSYDRAINLARDTGSTILFDEISQTPYFTYSIFSNGNAVSHIVWFIDARSINSFLELVSEYELHGIAIWNITIYNAQLWLIINSQYEIEKLI